MSCWGMAEIIRVLVGDEWRVFREVRLAALEDAPEAFAARAADEASHDEQLWRERLDSARHLVAERDGATVGVVGVGLHQEDPEIAEVFGLWTDPAVRGERIAWDLVSAAAGTAARGGCRLLYFWAGCDNVSAISFASSFGFRPTDERRRVRIADGAHQETSDEVAMVLPLVADPREANNLYQI